MRRATVTLVALFLLGAAQARADAHLPACEPELGLPGVCQPAGELEWTDKLGRGFLNVLFGPWLEVPATMAIHKEGASRWVEIPMNITDAVLLRWWLRLGTGVVDIMTAPTELPYVGNRPLMRPAYTFEPLLEPPVQRPKPPTSLFFWAR